MDFVFLAIMRFPLKRRDSFFYLKKRNNFLENGLESSFCGPRIFGYYAFPTKKARLVFLFKKKKTIF